ncbi:type III polyketide synthase [Microvirga lotononidis]|uniref:Putative naringenin-chalcone synthase n=1 Tax=Microvirga lotononidis TaxID=864069 RepID=I4YY57_9HYPH|nr:type III polyketide synthase [Microvirga lotononidis]EIM28899.1 putative naringenin-chalcone synthase [Microvirga lotononidis]WQO26819.1 type III polyketide synthase [Microvirga lotononidis]
MARLAGAYINRIGTAVPQHDVHQTFIGFVDQFLPERKDKLIFRRMVQRSGIEHRYSTLTPSENLEISADQNGFFQPGRFAGTGARMKRFETHAVDLAQQAIEALDLNEDLASATHLVVASCTGFTAPGLDQQIMERLGLDPSIERTMVGFMGCAAAVNALKVAHHIVRSEPSAKVLVVNLELCTLHLQETPDIEVILSALLFGDGCAASLISAEPKGIALKDFRVATIPETRDLITWRIGDAGFEMSLSGEVPGQIARALRHEATRNDESGILRGQHKDDFDLWAVHAGGRTILDAVEQGLDLAPDALNWSRGVLRDFGNMSSATLMFVLHRMMQDAPRKSNGFGMAFGPGLVAETFRFTLAE